MPLLFFRWGNEGSERDSHLSEVTQPVSSRRNPPITPLWITHSLALMAGEDAADGGDFLQRVER